VSNLILIRMLENLRKWKEEKDWCGGEPFFNQLKSAVAYVDGEICEAINKSMDSASKSRF
jgi:hypothetical protein